MPGGRAAAGARSPSGTESRRRPPRTVAGRDGGGWRALERLPSASTPPLARRPSAGHDDVEGAVGAVSAAAGDDADGVDVRGRLRDVDLARPGAAGQLVADRRHVDAGAHVDVEGDLVVAGADA